MPRGEAVAASIANAAFSGLGLGATIIAAHRALPTVHAALEGMTLDGPALVRLGILTAMSGSCLAVAAATGRSAVRAAKALKVDGLLQRTILTTGTCFALVSGVLASQALVYESPASAGIAALTAIGAVACGAFTARRTK